MLESQTNTKEMQRNFQNSCLDPQTPKRHLGRLATQYFSRKAKKSLKKQQIFNSYQKKKSKNPSINFIFRTFFHKRRRGGNHSQRYYFFNSYFSPKKTKKPLKQLLPKRGLSARRTKTNEI